MPRRLGSGRMGAVRSLRLPLALDRWFEDRLRERPSVGTSELLLELLHGGLRLRAGYLNRHVASLRRLKATDADAYAAYIDVLRQTFGDPYVLHIEAAVSAVLEVKSAL